MVVINMSAINSKWIVLFSVVMVAFYVVIVAAASAAGSI
jgi:membrane-bound acyltransferase YfiQ involved in biofilm formation